MNTPVSSSSSASRWFFSRSIVLVDEVRKKFGVPLVSQIEEPFKLFSIPCQFGALHVCFVYYFREAPVPILGINIE